MGKFFKNKGGKTCIYTSQPYDNYQNNSESHAPHAFHSVILAKGLRRTCWQDVNAALVKSKAGKDQEGENNVTLLGILNSLDGITAQEGSVVFTTADHIWKLTLALIRLGHCNRRLLFDYADEHQVQDMFFKFFLGRSLSGQAINELLQKSICTHGKVSPKRATASVELDPMEQAHMDAYNANIFASLAEESSDDSDYGSESDFISDSDYDEDVKGGLPRDNSDEGAAL
ncbi:hypothetical protein BG006_010265 [Podila minutissima]|uniref:Uncharacterized protein n=1 Tax=Podila minutissima TaxID=64525 RepID=A0A9P5SUM8_9FUNG|nr:hypothetical protein BG006_010265 [Podila minutissima]